MTTPPDRFADDAGPGAAPGEGHEKGRPSACEFFNSVAAELALGSLTGAERSAALSHLEGCEECSAVTTDLSAAADALLWAAPEADPPAGFEVRWLARVRPEGAPVAPASVPPASVPPASVPPSSVPPSSVPPASVPPTAPPGGTIVGLRRPRKVWFAAAAAAIVIAGAGVGLGLAVAPRQAPPQSTGQIRLASLRAVSSYTHPAAAGAAVGEVAVTGGSPSWILMTLEEPGWSGTVECVISQHGRERNVGTFYLHEGTGTWALRLPSPGASVTGAEVRDLSGSVLATATFASSPAR